MEYLDPKSPNEVIKYEVDFIRDLEDLWHPGIDIASSEYRRPLVPNGFAYIGTAGQTSSEEPVWPLTVDETVVDGGVTWTAKAASTNGLESISTTTVLVQSGISVSGTSTDGTVVSFIVSSGLADREYEIIIRITTSGGQTLEAALILPVRHTRRC